MLDSTSIAVIRIRSRFSLNYTRGGGGGGGGDEFDGDEARDEIVVEYLKKAALCGERRALFLLAESYEKGKHGLVPFPEMARCLRGMLKVNQNAVGCGVTLDEDRLPEPSEVLVPTSKPILRP